MSEVILIVEDEPDLARTVAYNLKKEGFQTRLAGDGLAAWKQATLMPQPDLILLDWMLPDTTGIAVCKRLRAHEPTRNIPVIMVTARGEEEDRVAGFSAGTDDYITKPFSVRELVLRVRAVLRRTQAPKEQKRLQLRCGVLVLDPDACRVWVEQEEVILTAMEFRLLETFLERKDRVQSRVQLIDLAWGTDGDVTDRTVDVNIKRLRKKLGVAGAYIETVWGMGYRLTLPEKEGSKP